MCKCNAGKIPAIKEFLKLSLGSPIGQLRAIPVALGENAPAAILAIYCADFDIDPYPGMFFFPTDTLKIVLFTQNGEILWKRDLGKAVVPGIWFCPVFAFDLDGDGKDEIWFVNNLNPDHPLCVLKYCLERVDVQNGTTTGQWSWPDNFAWDVCEAFRYRYFIAGGYVRNEPVLITAQGTYQDMFFQAWNFDMTSRWNKLVKNSDPGARGSHMCPISDVDKDGIQEILWGERCIELDKGTELFCADKEKYRGHSDVVIPVYDRTGKRWYIYTCREGEKEVSPRVVLFDSLGRQVWGAVEEGHMDIGWIARIGIDEDPIAMAIKIGEKTCGPDGRFHQDIKEYTFNALTGKPYPLPYSVYRTIPVDLNGDGFHELVRGMPGSNGEVFDRSGNRIGSVDGPVALASKFINLPGEQLLAYYPDGTVKIWADFNAKDSKVALERYNSTLYKVNQKLMAVGYNLCALTGL